MASIQPRQGKDGTVRYLAQVVVKRGGIIVRRENKTFPDERQARAWAANREVNREAASDDPTLSAVIDTYLGESRKAVGRTKAQVLEAIKRHPIGSKRCSRITSASVVSFAQGLQSGRTPQTVMNYLSHLGSVFAIARPAWGYPLDPEAVQDAMKVCKRLGYISKSQSRDRRPTVDELHKIVTHFEEVRRRRTGNNPMDDIVRFAVFSTRRQEEITLLRWDDLDVEHSRILVRDMKHPGQKIGNDQWCDLTPEALTVALAQPRRGDLIFPHNTDAISAAFTRACKLLGIEDLRFHDLRHDGISRLFEMGWNIPQVAVVSGHRSWQSLKRYTHIRQRGDKYADWKKKTPAD